MFSFRGNEFRQFMPGNELPGYFRMYSRVGRSGDLPTIPAGAGGHGKTCAHPTENFTDLNFHCGRLSIKSPHSVSLKNSFSSLAS